MAARTVSPRSSFFFGPFLTKCRKSAIGLFVFLSVTGVTVAGRWLLAVVGRGPQDRSRRRRLPVSVRVVEVRDEVVASGVRYSAVVKELNKAELSFRVGGTVEFLHQVEGPGGKMRPIHEGDTLKQGEVIARLDPADFRRDRDAAASQLATARAKLAEAESRRRAGQSRVPPRRAAHHPQRAQQVRRGLGPHQAAHDVRGADTPRRVKSKPRRSSSRKPRRISGTARSRSRSPRGPSPPATSSATSGSRPGRRRFWSSTSPAS